MKKQRFKPPGDVKQFWLAPHCGPGTLDADKPCGFCGDTHRDCAAQFSDLFATATEEELDQYHRSMLGHGDPPRGCCGGSGLWCSGCGRFWAQDSCGELSDGEWKAADGAKLVIADAQVYCTCGKRLCKC